MPLSKLLRHYSTRIQLYIAEALSAAKMAQNFLTRQRSDASFESFYSLTIEDASQITNEPVLPRYK